ncbi:2-phosphosulfolactate phosphatase [Paenibacillus thiaminolyticus]|nr:2-phosphosulfolactate phosphatase [Paenibacillus thiaminolyticus]
MQVDVIASVNEARAIELANRTVIVIDVLRATSTIITALAHGAAGILPVETVQQAKQAARDGDITGGERNCKKYRDSMPAILRSNIWARGYTGGVSC